MVLGNKLIGCIGITFFIYKPADSIWLLVGHIVVSPVKEPAFNVLQKAFVAILKYCAII